MSNQDQASKKRVQKAQRFPESIWCGKDKRASIFERLDILLVDRAQAVCLEIGVNTLSTTGNNFASEIPCSPSIADTESGKHPFDVF
jgi:hypothetical protein